MRRPTARRWLIFGAAVLAAGVATVAFALILFVATSSPIRTQVDDIGRALASFVATVACAWAAYRATGRQRLGWILMALSAGAWNIGEAIWSISQLQLGVSVPFPSWADLGFVAAIPFAFAATVMFWQPGYGPQSP